MVSCRRLSSNSGFAVRVVSTAVENRLRDWNMKFPWVEKFKHTNSPFFFILNRSHVASLTILSYSNSLMRLTSSWKPTCLDKFKEWYIRPWSPWKEFQRVFRPSQIWRSMSSWWNCSTEFSRLCKLFEKNSCLLVMVFIERHNSVLDNVNWNFQVCFQKLKKKSYHLHEGPNIQQQLPIVPVISSVPCCQDLRNSTSPLRRWVQLSKFFVSDCLYQI